MRGGRRIVLALAIFCGGSFYLPARVAAGGLPLDDRLGIATARLFLLLRSDIQKDLGLEAAQITEINRAAAEFYAKALNLKGKKGPGLVAARQAIDAGETEWLSTHLNPKQRERLGQIDLQWEGASALLNRPVVAEYLGLSPDQQTQVARVISDAQAQRGRAIPWSYESHLEVTRSAIALLSEKQRKQWAHVLGAPCRFVIATTVPRRETAGSPPDAPADGR